MSFPAFDTFFADPGATPGRIKVYLALRRLLDFAEPRAVKLEQIARAARVRVSTACDAFRWLAGHGYVVIHARDRRRMAMATLAYSRKLSTPMVGAASAA